MFPEVESTLIDRATIAARVAELGRQIASDLQEEIAAEGGDPNDGGRIVFVPILTGATVFIADLIRELPLKLSIGVVAVSSYPGRSLESKGAIIRTELPKDLGGRHVVIVDDILDSGQTLALVKRLVLEQEPASVRLCVMLRKDVPKVEEVDVDYVGFDIPNRFIVGYGLDFDGYYRNCPDIVTLKDK